MGKPKTCDEMELLCRKRAALDPNQGWKWMARADRWRNLGRRNVSAIAEDRDLFPAESLETEGPPH